MDRHTLQSRAPVTMLQAFQHIAYPTVRVRRRLEIAVAHPVDVLAQETHVSCRGCGRGHRDQDDMAAAGQFEGTLELAASRDLMGTRAAAQVPDEEELAT